VSLERLNPELLDLIRFGLRAIIASVEGRGDLFWVGEADVGQADSAPDVLSRHAGTLERAFAVRAIADCGAKRAVFAYLFVA